MKSPNSDLSCAQILEGFGCDIQIHPAAELFPMMTESAQHELFEDIRLNGVQEPIKLVGTGRDDAQLIDGRNRLLAILALNLDPYEFAEIIHPDDLGDAVQYVMSLNLHRRHLTDSQRAMVATKVATLKHGANQHTAIAVSSSQADAAEKLNVSVDSVQRARKVVEHAVPAIVDAVERGEVSVSAAAAVSSLPASEQQQLVAEGPKAIQQAAAKQRHRKTAMDHAQDAVSFLEKIPKNDKLRARGLETVSDWIAYNSPPDEVNQKAPLAELRSLFDEMEKPDEDAVSRFAIWVMAQTDYATIKDGCAAWLAWGNEVSA